MIRSSRNALIKSIGERKKPEIIKMDERMVEKSVSREVYHGGIFEGSNFIMI